MWRKRFGSISVCPHERNVSVSGHAVGQGQALGFSPLTLAAFPESDQSEANRGGHPDINPAEGRTIQHPYPAKAPDKGQDQDKNCRQGRKDEVEGPNAFSSVWNHPGSALSAHTLLLSLPWLLVLVFPNFNWLPWLLGSCSFEAEKEAGDQPALLSHMSGDGPVCVNSLPSTQSVPTALVTRHTPW